MEETYPQGGVERDEVEGAVKKLRIVIAPNIGGITMEIMKYGENPF